MLGTVALYTQHSRVLGWGLLLIYQFKIMLTVLLCNCGKYSLQVCNKDTSKEKPTIVLMANRAVIRLLIHRIIIVCLFTAI